MSESPESKQSFLDDPEKTMVAVAAGALAVFAVVHELVPAHHQDTVKLLGSLDLTLNIVSWRAIHRGLKIRKHEPVSDQSLPTQPQPEAA